MHIRLLMSKQIIYINSHIYGPLTYAINLSILLQYYRIFLPSRRYNRFLWWGSLLLIIINLVWCIISTLMGIFICSPVRKAWDPLVPGHCYDEKKVLLSTSGIRVLSEVATLVLPIPAIWRLQMSKRKRFGMTAIFGLVIL